MKLYIASSWRNNRYPVVVDCLRDAGHECYDWREHGFRWIEVNKMDDYFSSYPALEVTLAKDRSREGFERDMNALRSCDACILVLASGRSAHLEAGWAIGAGKPTAILYDFTEKVTPELMYLMADKRTTELAEIVKWLEQLTLPQPQQSRFPVTYADYNDND